MNTIACHVCGSGFAAVRRDARFCSAACRKSASRTNVPEAPQNRTSSPSKRRREDEVFDLNMVLCEAYYGMPPAARASYLENLIDLARAGNPRLREVLSNLFLLRTREGSRKTNFRRSRAYPTIAQEAHRFTTSRWGVHVREAVRNT